MDSNSIIMVAYYFPPEGNAAVYRPLRFLKGLVNKGWRATVISCEPYKYERHDLKLLDQVPSTVPIVRVRERDPGAQETKCPSAPDRRSPSSFQSRSQA